MRRALREKQKHPLREVWRTSPVRMLLIVQTKLFSGEASTGALKRPLRADAFTLPERERLSVPKHAVSFSIK